jgi:predicted metallo-beta-lactamase superfamily hydrolase
LGYVYHHLSMSSEETVKVKESFERYAKSYGVNIKHYHTDNGRFKDKAFMKSIEDSGQIYQLLRSRSPQSKWDCREENRRPTKEGHNLTIACTEKMDRCHNHISMAICTEST